MPRTTVNLDASVLKELKLRAREEGRSLGNLISEVVATALAQEKAAQATSRFRWKTSQMGPHRVDLEDKEAVRQALGRV